MILHLMTIAVLIFFSGIFSGSETALFSLSIFQKRKMQLDFNKNAKSTLKLLASPRQTLATILIGNMLVNITATSIATIVFVRIFGKTGVIFSIIFMTTALLLFGEVTPKIMAIQNPEKFSKFVAVPISVFGKIIFPVRWVLQKISSAFILLFSRQSGLEPFITEKELKTMVSISKKEGIIDEEEEKMIHSIFEFGDRRVDEIMTPRVDIIGCDKTAPKQELIAIMKQHKLSKIPIYEEDVDHIIGVVYTKTFMLNPKDDWDEYIKQPLFIPEAETIDDLLVKFQTKKNYIAIILDEFGGTSGLITMEDVLEEIVGEIHDEYDKEEQLIQKNPDSTFTISGKALIKDVNEHLNISLPTEEVTTMNGLVMLLFDRVPRKNESIKFADFTFTVIDVDREEKRINKILLKR